MRVSVCRSAVSGCHDQVPDSTIPFYNSKFHSVAGVCVFFVLCRSCVFSPTMREALLRGVFSCIFPELKALHSTLARVGFVELCHQAKRTWGRAYLLRGAGKEIKTKNDSGSIAGRKTNAIRGRGQWRLQGKKWGNS